jgi:hypothetical protein
MSENRRQRILAALKLELQRQRAPAGLDLTALAAAVEAALGAPPAPMDEGRTPDELNSANDD